MHSYEDRSGPSNSITGIEKKASIVVMEAGISSHKQLRWVRIYEEKGDLPVGN